MWSNRSFGARLPKPGPGSPGSDANDEPQMAVRSNHVEGRSNAYLPDRVIGKAMLALIDTGFEPSLVPTTLMKKIDIKSSRQLLKAANCTEIRVIGETKLSCEINGY